MTGPQSKSQMTQIVGRNTLNHYRCSFLQIQCGGDPHQPVSRYDQLFGLAAHGTNPCDRLADREIRHAFAESFDISSPLSAWDKRGRGFILSPPKIDIHKVHTGRVNPDERFSTLGNRIRKSAQFENLRSAGCPDLYCSHIVSFKNRVCCDTGRALYLNPCCQRGVAVWASLSTKASAIGGVVAPLSTISLLVISLP